MSAMPKRRAAMTEAEDRGRLPVALLTGFLGSGKTTLLNALLRDPCLADTAVAINEFGETPLDQDLVAHDDDKTLVMANGCLCCNLAGDFEEAVMRIFSRLQLDMSPIFSRLIVEPSGLADPAPIAQAVLRNPVLSRFLRLESIIATVDAVFGRRHLAEWSESRKQVAMADRIVLTKADLVRPRDLAALEAEVANINPHAPRIYGDTARSKASLVFPARFFDAEAETPSIATWLADFDSHPMERRLLPDGPQAGHDHGATSISIVCGTPLVWREFEDWLRRIRIDWSNQLLRVKGILNLAGCALPVVVQGVHHVLHPAVELDRWPSDDRRSRLVFITEGAASREILVRWEESASRLMTPQFQAHAGPTA
jgi:G3E family GTPase